MQNLSILTKDEAIRNDRKEQMITSLEVAGMVEKQHNELLKDIRRYIEQLGEGNFPHTDFFTESTYVTEQNKLMPCFNVTKKGCEFIAHKMTGVKGAVFTARYINRFHEMEDYIIDDKVEKIAKPTIGEITKAAEFLSEIYRDAGADIRYIANMAGNMYKEIGMNIPLPPIEMKEAAIYDQTEIAKKLGVLSASSKPHSQAIGAIIEKISIAADDKICTPFTNNGHSGVVTQYKEKVVDMIKDWLEENSYPSEILSNNKKFSVRYAN